MIFSQKLAYASVHTRDRILHLICLVFSSFASYIRLRHFMQLASLRYFTAEGDATSCGLFGISRGREWCHRHVKFLKLPCHAVHTGLSLCSQAKGGGVAYHWLPPGATLKPVTADSRRASKLLCSYTYSLFEFRFRMPLICFCCRLPRAFAANTVPSVAHLIGVFTHQCCEVASF